MNERRLSQKYWLQLKELGVVLLILAMFSMTVPALAADAQTVSAGLQDENTFTLEQITKQIQQHNRVNQQYQLNLNLLDENHTKAKNTRNDVQSTLQTVYNKENDAYNSLSTVGKNQATVKQGMQQIEKKYAMLYPNATAAELQEKLLSDSTYMSLQAQLTSLTGMESQLNSGIMTADSSVEQLWDGIDKADKTLRTLENKQDDVLKSQSDWNEEVKLLTNLLVRKTITMEETQDLLQQKQELIQKQYNVGKKQEEIGLSVPVKTKDIQITLDDTKTQLKQVSDGVHLLKRQINDLMGRSLDAPLNIVPIGETGFVADLPVYSKDILEQAKEKDYTLKTLQRNIDNNKEDAQDLKDKGHFESDTLKIYDLDNELSKVSMQDQETAIDNDLKKLIDSVNVAGRNYEEKMESYYNEKTKYQQNQKYKEVGLISPLAYQAAALEFQQSALARKQAAYDYSLARMEYNAFLNGIDLSTYEKYKGL